MNTVQERFFKTRIERGHHLPTDIVDGLVKLKEGKVELPNPDTAQTLIWSLIVLEQHRSPDGTKLQTYRPEDEEAVAVALETTKSIINKLCRWET